MTFHTVDKCKGCVAIVSGWGKIVMYSPRPGSGQTKRVQPDPPGSGQPPPPRIRPNDVELTRFGTDKIRRILHIQQGLDPAK